MSATPRSRFIEEPKRLREEIEKKHGKTTEQLYEEREKRVRDTIALRGTTFRDMIRTMIAQEQTIQDGGSQDADIRPHL